MSPEQAINECIKSSNYNSFEHNYYQITPTPYYKSIMLLFLLSRDRRPDYYKLLQTINLEEISNEFISFVIELDLLINTCNIKKIKELTTNCRYQEFTFFLNIIYDNLIKDNDETVVKASKNNEYTIQDMMYIINNAK